jgi:hypothetical protein
MPETRKQPRKVRAPNVLEVLLIQCDAQVAAHLLVTRGPQAMLDHLSAILDKLDEAGVSYVVG